MHTELPSSVMGHKLGSENLTGKMRTRLVSIIALKLNDGIYNHLSNHRLHCSYWLQGCIYKHITI